jgi:hypothetical protein
MLTKQSGQFQVKRNDSFDMRHLNNNVNIVNHFQFYEKSELDVPANNLG